MRTSINWGVMGIFGVLIIGFIVAGFLVPEDATTDDGHPLGVFFWFMGGMFALSTGGILLFATISNRKRAMREANWMDARAEILEVSETGTYINNQPRLKFRLLVHSPVHGDVEVVHKQVIPLTALAGFSTGASITVKVDPADSRRIQFT
jgi:hypothetical protein